MMRAWILSLSLGLLSAGAQASLLKTDCNLDKALKNEAVNATLGVKGNCDTSKLVKQEKEKVKAEVQKGRTDLLERYSAICLRRIWCSRRFPASDPYGMLTFRYFQ